MKSDSGEERGERAEEAELICPPVSLQPAEAEDRWEVVVMYSEQCLTSFILHENTWVEESDNLTLNLSLLVTRANQTIFGKYQNDNIKCSYC